MTAHRDDQRDAMAFVTTRWSVVLQAGGESADAEAALSQLCRDYWYPLYAYARRRGLTTHDAQDVTQSFFEHLMEAGMLRRANAERGRFRTFLLASLQNFLANTFRRQQAQKRGGGATPVALDGLNAEERFALEPADPITPECQFERSWAYALIERVFRRLGSEYAAAGRIELFEQLQPYLAGKTGQPGYEAVGRNLGMTEGRVAVIIHRMRRRYGELLREEIAHTVESPGEIEEEIAYLREVVAR